MKVTQPNLSEYFSLPNPGLRAYLSHVESGQPNDYRPPFWKGKSRSWVLDQWQHEFDRLGIDKQYPGLYDFEMEMKSKVGPMSIQLPLKDRMESIDHYFTQDSGEPIDPEAIQKTIQYFSGINGIRLRSVDNTVAKMRLNTNSGSWLFSKRKRVLDETLTSQFDTASGLFMTADGRGFKPCAVLGWRGQEGGIESADVKQRVVWMMPFLLNIEELRFYQPAIEAIQKLELIPAYVSMECVDKQVTKLFDTKGQDDVVICTDFSKFDQHFNVNMQAAAKEIITAQLSNDSKYWADTLFHWKFDIPLLLSSDKMVVGAHGMGSGSGGTNYDECMSHKSLQFESALRSGAQLNPYSMAYGDDGILTYPGITVEQVVKTYTRHGQEMNPDKQYVSKTDCVVLRRWHSMSYRINGTMVGVYSTFRALGRLLAQERFYDPKSWGPEQVTLRAWSILENCKYSPYFEKFVDFCMKGDKYRLGLDIPGFIENVSKIALEAIDNMPDFLGYTKSQQQSPEQVVKGIKDWRIYKYVVSKK